MASTTGRRAFGVPDFLGAGLSLVLSASALTAQATPLLCSITQAIECDETLGCAPYSEEAPPTFLHIDLDRSLVTILGPPERRGETTEINHSTVLETQWIHSGVQAGKGWTMAISKADGSMSMAVTEEHVGFVVFGRCIASDQLSP